MGIAQHRKFDLGMNQDVGSILLPEGYCYSARNMLFDKLGIPRKRGGITGVGATTTYQADNIGTFTNETTSLRVYARQGAGAALYAINTLTGVMTALNPGTFTLPLVNEGRPFAHYGFMGFPGWQDDSTIMEANAVWVGGSDGLRADYFFAVPAGVVMTAGDKRITCNVADSPTGLMKVGMLIEILPNGGPLTGYIGRVTRLVSTTSFEVYPTPGISLTGANVFSARAYSAGASTMNGGNSIIGSKVAMSFQGRVVLGNISRETVAPNRVELYPRRVWFSSTLLEGDTTGSAVRLVNGATWLSQNGYPGLNYFDVPAQEAITALTPTGFGDALIFTAFRTYRLTGNLTTQFGTEQSVTWAPREIPNSVGCMSERSLQRTPRGVIFAHDSGVYSTDGSSMQPLMYQRVTNYWNALVSGANFAIYGSALIRGNHYYICGVSGGSPWALMVNLDTLAWGTVSGKAASPASFLVNSSAQDPVTPTTSWGLKWYGQGAAVSMTGGQLVKLDDMFFPTSSNRSDSDGTVVSFEYVTKPYQENSSLQKTWYDATVAYRNQGGAKCSVHPDFVLDVANMDAGGFAFSLPDQFPYVITGATNAAPIVITIAAGHNIAVDNWVRIVNTAGITSAVGLWRVQAVTATTITLMGSIGNAAYISGGTCQAVDQRDLSLLVAASQGGGSGNPGSNPTAVAYRINDTDLGAAGSDFFELVSITHTWEDRDEPAE